jgi:hypothetical protein
MKVRAIWEFEADVEDIDTKFVDIIGLAKDLAKNELQYLIKNCDNFEDDFEYSVVVE